MLAVGAARADPLTDRIAQSAVAAQALQGPFDGAWTLRDGSGVLFTFQMSDPPGATGTVEGAWRDGGGRVGAAQFVPTDRLRLQLVIDDAPPMIFILTSTTRGAWRGFLPGHGVVTLTRGLATPRPPV